MHLYRVYTQSLKDSLGGLSQELTELDKSLDKSAVSCDDDFSTLSFERFASVLAFFDPEKQFTELHAPVRKLFEELVQTLNGRKSAITKIYFALVGKSSTWMMEVFLQVSYKLRWKEMTNGSTDEMSVWLKAVCEEGNRKTAWRDMYTVCLQQNKHFLDMVMVSTRYPSYHYSELPITIRIHRS